MQNMVIQTNTQTSLREIAKNPKIQDETQEKQIQLQFFNLEQKLYPSNLLILITRPIIIELISG